MQITIITYYFIRFLIAACLFLTAGSFVIAYIRPIEWRDNVVIGLGFLVAAVIIYAFGT